ncbi:unnamed protein product [Fraxinus pennsylvanica]|uniref:Uncharacterized protein n=1 Tax=Fraxinus pennsylvanica TaxID=56036 RepID=A0AAD1ZFY2_9LAMI|nr:unnamed protein product [Fraxinus pennsylvanica]
MRSSAAPSCYFEAAMEGMMRTVLLRILHHPLQWRSEGHLCQITPFDPAKKKKKKVVIRDPAEDDIVDNLAEKTESLFVSDGLETSFACLKKKKKSVHTNLLSDEKENVGGDRDRVQQLTLTRLCSFNFQLQIYTFFLSFLPFRSLFEFARHRIAVLSLKNVTESMAIWRKALAIVGGVAVWNGPQYFGLEAFFLMGC